MVVRCLRFRTSPLLSSSLWFDLSRHCLSSSLLFHSSSSTGGCLSATSNSASSATTTAGGGGAIVDEGGREWSAALPDGCGGERGGGGSGGDLTAALPRWWWCHCSVLSAPLLGEDWRPTDGRTDGGGGAEEPLSLFPSSCSFVFVRRVMFLSAAGRERFLVGDSTTF